MNIEFYISNVVFNEIHHIAKNELGAERFRDIIAVKTINDLELKSIKQDLVNIGVKPSRHAQDPDLTLVALAKKLIAPESKVFLVSDDFKLSENVKELNYKIEFLSLSSFLLFLSRNSKNTETTNYFKKIRDGTLKYTLGYMLERNETYNAQNKLMWLIEKAVNVADDGGFDIKGSSTGIKTGNDSGSASDMGQTPFSCPSIEDINSNDEDFKHLQRICHNYIHNKKISSKDLDQIALMLPLLDDVLKGKRYLRAAKEALKEDRTRLSIGSLKAAKDSLMLTLQNAGSILPKEKYTAFQNVTCTELGECEFLHAFLLIGLNRIEDSIESLSSGATYFTVAKATKSVLTINYLKALILMFHEMYDKAIEQFQFTNNLAVNYVSNDLLILKCQIGRAIALFLSGMQSEAVDLIDRINKQTQIENLENKVIVFQDLGDYFYAISRPKIAISLYGEALECAVDYEENEWRINIIHDKMKRAYMSALLSNDHNENTTHIDMIIDKVHELKNVEKYSEEIGKLSNFNQLFYTEFPIFTEDGKTIGFFDIDKSLREIFDVVDIMENRDSKTTVLIAFNKEIGLIGFRVKLKTRLLGFPEDYTVRLTKKAKIQIIKPSKKLKSKYLIRAIIQVDNLNYIEIDRNIPIFFSQMNI